MLALLHFSYSTSLRTLARLARLRAAVALRGHDRREAKVKAMKEGWEGGTKGRLPAADDQFVFAHQLGAELSKCNTAADRWERWARLAERRPRTPRDGPAARAATPPGWPTP